MTWRFVQWAIEQEPRLAEVLGELAEPLHREGSASAITPRAQAMLQWGVVDDALRPALRARALRETVLPCAQELLRRAGVAGARVASPAGCLSAAC